MAGAGTKRGGRHQADDALLNHLLQGFTAKECASQCHVSVRTVFRRLADEAFLRRLEQRRADFRRALADQAACGVREALIALRQVANGPSRVKTLNAKIRACEALLDYDSKAVMGAEQRRALRDAAEAIAESLFAGKQP